MIYGEIYSVPGIRYTKMQCVRPCPLFGPGDEASCVPAEHALPRVIMTFIETLILCYAG